MARMVTWTLVVVMISKLACSRARPLSINLEYKNFKQYGFRRSLAALGDTAFSSYFAVAYFPFLMTS